MIDHLDAELDTLDTTLARIARHQQGCNALKRRYGTGWLTSIPGGPSWSCSGG
jgi:hypothetical protein